MIDNSIIEQVRNADIIAFLEKYHGFTMAACAPSDRLYVFERSLTIADTGDKNAWKQHSRLSLAGTSDTAIPFFLNQHKSVTTPKNPLQPENRVARKASKSVCTL